MKPATKSLSGLSVKRQRVGHLHDVAVAHDADAVAHGSH